jgi:Acyl-coenzyme A oxidase N-terminal
MTAYPTAARGHHHGQYIRYCSSCLQMWIPALMGQASEEQQQRWLPPSQRLEVSLLTRLVPPGLRKWQRAGCAPALQHTYQLGLVPRPTHHHYYLAGDWHIRPDGAWARHLCARPGDDSHIRR